MILNLTTSSPSLVFSANDLIRLAMHCFAVRHKQVPLPTPKKTAKLQVAQILLPTFFYMVVEHTNFEKPTVNTCFISCDVERYIYICICIYYVQSEPCWEQQTTPTENKPLGVPLACRLSKFPPCLHSLPEFMNCKGIKNKH